MKSRDTLTMHLCLGTPSQCTHVKRCNYDTLMANILRETYDTRTHSINIHALKTKRSTFIWHSGERMHWQHRPRGRHLAHSQVKRNTQELEIRLPLPRIILPHNYNFVFFSSNLFSLSLSQLKKLVFAPCKHRQAHISTPQLMAQPSLSERSRSDCSFPDEKKKKLLVASNSRHVEKWIGLRQAMRLFVLVSASCEGG